MSTLAALFVTILLLNLAPAFAPPTWMAMSWLGFSRPGDDPLLMALVAASAATSGRLMLAKASRSLVRGRWMSDADRRNVDVAKAWIERRRRVTAWALLAYAFSPLPSNYLFIAYGLTGLPLRLISVPFFFGRLASYALWASLGQFTHDYVEPESNLGGAYLGLYFAASQLAFLALVYAFAKIDWAYLQREHKLRLRRAEKDEGGPGR